MQAKLNRRTFLRRAAGTAVTGVCMGVVRSNPLRANEDIRIAIVGLNGHGAGAHLKRYLQMPGVRVVALCDADRSVLDRSLRLVDQAGVRVRTFTDIRKLLAEPDLDAISGATPNHWHALSTVWA